MKKNAWDAIVEHEKRQARKELDDFMHELWLVARPFVMATLYAVAIVLGIAVIIMALPNLLDSICSWYD